MQPLLHKREALAKTKAETSETFLQARKIQSGGYCIDLSYLKPQNFNKTTAVLASDILQKALDFCQNQVADLSLLT